MNKHRLFTRQTLLFAALSLILVALTACGAATPEIITETIVETVEVQVVETVEVQVVETVEVEVVETVEVQVVETVEVADVRGFIAQVEGLGGGRLHAIGELVLCDPRFDFRITDGLECLFV